MSLNQLAEEMWEKLDYSSVDSSVLSRVLKGERLFTSKSAPSFLQYYLRNNWQEEDELFDILTNEYFTQFGLKDMIEIQKKTKFYIDLLDENIKKISDIKSKIPVSIASGYITILTKR